MNQTVPESGAKPREMKKFLNEYHYSSGRHGPLINSTLPDPGELLHACDVRMPKESLVRFRNDYLLLIHFAALMCNTTPDKLCPFDLMAPFLRTEPDDEY